MKDEVGQKALMQKSGEIIAEILDDDLETTDTETTVELNFTYMDVGKGRELGAEALPFSSSSTQ